jgi:hypothetical protein
MDGCDGMLDWETVILDSVVSGGDEAKDALRSLTAGLSNISPRFQIRSSSYLLFSCPHALGT